MASGSGALRHGSTERPSVRRDKGEPFAAAVIIHAPVDILFCGLDGGEMARDIATIEYAVAAVAFLLDSESTITHFCISISNRPAGIAQHRGRWLTRPGARNGAACRACSTWLDGRVELSVQSVSTSRASLFLVAPELRSAWFATGLVIWNPSSSHNKRALG